MTTQHIAFNSARFLKSSSKLANCPEDSGREVAFAGRSNAGKSSAINCLTSQRKLARTSKTPGRTQLINFFSLNVPDRRLVDLPGYGFARVSHEVRDAWQRHLDHYLRARLSLAGLVLVMDIRHPLTDFDRAMCNWCAEAELPLLILLTKSDKVKNGEARTTRRNVLDALDEHPSLDDAILFSSLKNLGVESAHAVLSTWLIPPE